MKHISSNSFGQRRLAANLDLCTSLGTAENAPEQVPGCDVLSDDLRAAAATSEYVFWVADASGSAIDVSRQWAVLTGQPAERSLDRGWRLRMHPKDFRRALRSWREANASGSNFACELRFRGACGKYKWTQLRANPILDGHGLPVRWHGTLADINNRKLAEISFRLSEALSRSVFEASADCIMIVDLDGRLELVNGPGLCAIEIEDFDAIRGTAWVDLWPVESRSVVNTAILDAATGKVARFSAFGPTATGTPKWWSVVVTPILDEAGGISRILSISRDITVQRGAAAQLKWDSEHDPLTGLANRRAFEARLQAATIRAMQGDTKVGLLLLDLDHFKHVNDTLGHAAGDHLLSVFGNRLTKSIRSVDFVARLGGDEFAVILEGKEGELDLAAAGASILARLQKPIRYDGRVMSAGASIGGAHFPADAQSANDLFKNADTALYALKESGRGGTSMFHQHMRQEAQLVSSQLSLARTAINQRSVEPHYQQKIDLITGRIAGFEALLRWRHATRGIQYPETVAEAFKDYELASKIGDLMQRRVFSDVRGWLDRGVNIGFVAINAAPVEFLRDDFAGRLLTRMREQDIPPHLVEIEITEHVFFERGADLVGRALTQLSEAGVRIALDDFGTGYSSLSHLRDYPVDVLKIDRSFIAKVTTDPEVRAIVCAVIDLARSLNIEIVAEGVETEDQKRFLIKHGCELGQGYLFGRAIEADKVPSLFENLLGRAGG